MSSLNFVDYTVIVIYFSILIGMGLYLQKRASASLEDYFLAGRSLPWWALGITGMAAWLDVTGTMIITSFLFLLGPRGLFIEFRGGAVLIAAVIMLWTGKWYRRSRCITGAEWMIFRFGGGTGGQFARLFSAFGMIALTIGMLTYMIKGIGIFLSMFLPFEPFTCALILVCVATIYTMASGFYGVVFTDLFQAGIVILAVIAISTMAILKVSSQESISVLAYEVTNNSSWVQSSPHWKTAMPKGYECYRYLFMFAMFYLIRNIVYGMGRGDDPKYLGARNDRECGTQTFLTVSCIMLRWPLMLAFAILGLYLVKDLFPNQGVLNDAAALIKSHIGNVSKADWATVLSGIIHHPQQYSQELVLSLKQLLGADWASKLQMVSFEGTVNPEVILPSVLLTTIPIGLRGMFLVALLAASMSTFDITVNTAAGYFTRDMYQRYIRPNSSNRELIGVTWLFVILIVAVGFAFAYSVESINDIWGWITMGLGAGMIVPSALKLYWWRFNGSGFALGIASGMIGAIVQRIFWPGLDERFQFIAMMLMGLIGSIIGTYLSGPADEKVLANFYNKTRPFGLWGRLFKTLSPEDQKNLKKEHRNDIMALPFALGWQITLFLLPMQLMVHSFRAFAVTFVIFLISLAGLYFIWYRNLPEKNNF
ncbi:MAG: sodium:solute symporter [Phycisphaerae bacterium]|nr:sodium:solute symporter [Phycisphaerae bacterium]